MVVIFTSSIYNLKNGLRRVRNYVGEQALHYEMMASSYVCQPNHKLTMQKPCFVYTVIIHVAVWLQVCYTVTSQNYPTKGIP